MLPPSTIITTSIAMILTVIVVTTGSSADVESVMGEQSTNVHCFLSAHAPTVNKGSGTNDSGYHCLRATWPNATISYVLDSSLKDTWRSKVEKVMTELSTKTCLQFLPVTGAFNDATTSVINLLPGTSSNKIRPTGASPLNISISSWEAIADELVDSLCIFYQGAYLDGVEGIVGLEESEAIINCLSGKSSIDGTRPGYINMLDAEKINALYNCGGCQSYRFFSHLLLGSTQRTLVPYIVGNDPDGYDLGLCRGYMRNQLAPGKLKIYANGTSICFIPYGTKEHSLWMNFEVLALPGADDFQWLPQEQPEVPPNALKAGGTRAGDTLYIGKSYVVQEGKPITALGKVHDHDPSFMFYGFDGKELGASKYELLVCKVPKKVPGKSPSGKVRSKLVFYYPSNDSIAFKIQRRRPNLESLLIRCQQNRKVQPCTVGGSLEPTIYFGLIDPLTNNFPIYRTIHDGTHALGSSSTIEGKMSQLVIAELGSAVANKTFHWYITRKEKYFQFVNRQTGMALDSNDASSAYAHSVNGGTFQDWKIVRRVKAEANSADLTHVDEESSEEDEFFSGYDPVLGEEDEVSSGRYPGSGAKRANKNKDS